MKLDQLLGSLSIDQLQDLLVVWAPDQAMSSSKLVLFRALRAGMTRPDRARHCLELAGPLGRGIIRRLLRSEGASRSLGVLGVTSGARPRSVEESRSAVGELAAMGLVCIEPEKRWETYGSARVSVPDELVAPLRGAAGIDGRPWPQVLDLAGHLAALRPDELRRVARKSGVACEAGTPVDELVARLAAPGSVSARLERLPPELCELVLAAVRGYGGLVPLERLLKDRDLREPEEQEAAASEWRRELEKGLLGTVGDVSLLEYGIDLDGPVFAVFTEVAEAVLSLRCAGEPKVSDPVGPDFLLDLSELLSVVRESGLRLKASGELTGAGAQRILSHLNRPNMALLAAQELLELRLACAEKLGLVERGKEFLVVRRSAWRWEQRRYEEKAGDLFGLIGSAAPVVRSKHHHAGLCEVARELLRSMEPGTWRIGGATEHIVLRRYLARMDSAGLRERIAEAVQGVAEYVLPPFPGLDQLRSDVHDGVVLEAYAMGVLDLAIDGGEVCAEGVSRFGATAAGRQPPPLAPARIITTADFEVVLLPEGDTTGVRYEVGQFAAREKFDQTWHLRVTKERVEEAVVRGLAADEMVRLLREHSETGAVPQNVEYSIRAWAERVRVATVEDVHVLELPDEKLLDLVSELPGIKRILVRRISATALGLSEWPGDRDLLAELRRLGIHVR